MLPSSVCVCRHQEEPVLLNGNTLSHIHTRSQAADIELLIYGTVCSRAPSLSPCPVIKHMYRKPSTHTRSHITSIHRSISWQVGPSGFATRGQRHSIIMQTIFCFNRNSMVQNRAGIFIGLLFGCVLLSGGFYRGGRWAVGGSWRSSGCYAHATIQQCILFSFSLHL